MSFWNCWVFIIGRATLTELWAAMEAILGAAMRREEAIAMDLGDEWKTRWMVFGSKSWRWSGVEVERDAFRDRAEKRVDGAVSGGTQVGPDVRRGLAATSNFAFGCRLKVG